MPTTKPNIYGLRSVYSLGSHLNLSCESGPSSPPPDLHWFLNGVKISSKDSSLVTSLDPYYPLDNKRGISRSQLNYPLIEEELPKFPKPVIIKCVAVIKEFYRKADKVRVKIIGRKRALDIAGEEDEEEADEYETTIEQRNDGLRQIFTSNASYRINASLLLFIGAICFYLFSFASFSILTQGM